MYERRITLLHDYLDQRAAECRAKAHLERIKLDALDEIRSKFEQIWGE